jgi:hypothetical protein
MIRGLTVYLSESISADVGSCCAVFLHLGVEYAVCYLRYTDAYMS